MATPSPETQETPAARPSPIQILRELRWSLLLPIGIGAGALWTLLLLQKNTVQFFAGLFPVLGGIMLGRNIRSHANWHGAVLSLLTTATAAIGGSIAFATIPNIDPAIKQNFLVAISLLVLFPAFGVITSARSEERARELREKQAQRGGRLERPGRVKTIEELQGLSLNQFGGYVADLFRGHGFLVDDFRFENRQNYIEFEMRYEDQPWVVRVTVEDKVKQGLVLEFHQYLRSRGLNKGVLVTSMYFQDQAERWAKEKPVALIDGPTLLTMND